jgi:putative DNA primase/helicase
VIKETTGAATLIPENIPEELAERPQWVCWRFFDRGGKMTKVPFTPGTDSRASTIDLMTWTTFEKALATYEDSDPGTPMGYGGIGFVFSSADPFVGIDLDDCRGPKSGKIAPWAQDMIYRVDAGYMEISPSGRGLHIIVKGTVRGGGMRKGPIEMYSRGRFFTITGRVL